jgi:hypothetical protein
VVAQSGAKERWMGRKRDLEVAVRESYKVESYKSASENVLSLSSALEREVNNSKHYRCKITLGYAIEYSPTDDGYYGTVFSGIDGLSVYVTPVFESSSSVWRFITSKWSPFFRMEHL